MPAQASASGTESELLAADTAVPMSELRSESGSRPSSSRSSCLRRSNCTSCPLPEIFVPPTAEAVA